MRNMPTTLHGEVNTNMKTLRYNRILLWNDTVENRNVVTTHEYFAKLKESVRKAINDLIKKRRPANREKYYDAYHDDYRDLEGYAEFGPFTLSISKNDDYTPGPKWGGILEYDEYEIYISARKLFQPDCHLWLDEEQHFSLNKTSKITDDYTITEIAILFAGMMISKRKAAEADYEKYSKMTYDIYDTTCYPSRESSEYIMGENFEKDVDLFLIADGKHEKRFCEGITYSSWCCDMRISKASEGFLMQPIIKKRYCPMVDSDKGIRIRTKRMLLKKMRDIAEVTLFIEDINESIILCFYDDPVDNENDDENKSQEI